jgi:hypothetical protein
MIETIYRPHQTMLERVMGALNVLPTSSDACLSRRPRAGDLFCLRTSAARADDPKSKAKSLGKSNDDAQTFLPLAS